MKTWLTIVALSIVIGALIRVRDVRAQDDSGNGYEGETYPNPNSYQTAPDSAYGDSGSTYAVPAPFGSDPSMAPPLNPEGYGNENTLPEDDGTNTMDGYSQPVPDDGGGE